MLFSVAIRELRGRADLESAQNLCHHISRYSRKNRFLGRIDAIPCASLAINVI